MIPNFFTKSTSTYPSRQSLASLGGAIEGALINLRCPATIKSCQVGPSTITFEMRPTWRSLKSGARTYTTSSAIRTRAADLGIVLNRPVSVTTNGKVGVVVGRLQRGLVRLGDIIQYADRRGMTIPLGLGTGVITMSLREAPHVLIAGATGSGKSVCINAIICSLLSMYGPGKLKMILIDPKKVELSQYESVPHVLDVVAELSDAEFWLEVLNYCMGRRYGWLEQARVLDIDQYNRARHTHHHEVKEYRGAPLHYDVLVIDEVADLMLTGSKEAHQHLIRLVQQGRAAGIHVIMATQRPGYRVIPGIIKANAPTRVAFRVASKVDSRVILDQNGAEELMGKGDMLYLDAGGGVSRGQGAYVDEGEIQNLVNYWKRRN